MPKVIETETLANVTYDLAMDSSIADVAKRNGVGRQWVYGWRDKLMYHGVWKSAYLSDELLRAICDKALYTPTFVQGYCAVDALVVREKRQRARRGDTEIWTDST